MALSLKTCILAGAALCGSFAFTNVASAIPMKAVWQGTYVMLADNPDLFTGTSNLFTATLFYDPATIGVNRGTDPASHSDRAVGGPLIQSASLQIGGHTETWVPNSDNLLYIENAGTPFTGHRAESYFYSGAILFNDYIEIRGFAANPLLPDNLENPFTTSIFGDYDGYFGISHFDPNDVENTVTAFSYGILHPNLLTVSRVVPHVSAVPIPAALPLFVSGLGVLGFVGRRRRKSKLSVAA